MRSPLAISISIAAPLLLAACAGTPPPGEARTAASGKCQHVTGSLLCEDETDPSLSGMRDPSVGQPQIFGGGGVKAGTP